MAGLADLDVPRQKRFELLNRRRLREIGKETREIGMRLKTVGLCRLDERVQVRTRRRTGGSVAEQPIRRRSALRSGRLGSRRLGGQGNRARYRRCHRQSPQLQPGAAGRHLDELSSGSKVRG